MTVFKFILVSRLDDGKQILKTNSDVNTCS